MPRAIRAKERSPSLAPVLAQDSRNRAIEKALSKLPLLEITQRLIQQPEGVGTIPEPLLDGLGHSQAQRPFSPYPPDHFTRVAWLAEEQELLELLGSWTPLQPHQEHLPNLSSNPTKLSVNLIPVAHLFA